MNADTLATLETRLRKLEKQNRILIAALVLGISLVACTSAMITKQGPLASSEVRANRFVLIDAKDNEVGVWEIDKSGFPVFVMGTNPAGRAFRLSEDKKGAGLTLRSPSANAASLTVTNDTASLMLPGTDAQGKRGYVSISGNAAPSVVFAHGSGAQLNFTPGSGMPIYCSRPNGKMDWFFSGTSLTLNGQKLQLCDFNGKPIKELP